MCFWYWFSFDGYVNIVVGHIKYRRLCILLQFFFLSLVARYERLVDEAWLDFRLPSHAPLMHTYDIRLQLYTSPFSIKRIGNIKRYYKFIYLLSVPISVAIYIYSQNVLINSHYTIHKFIRLSLPVCYAIKTNYDPSIKIHQLQNSQFSHGAYFAE